jgi:hypothetical protein
LLCQDFIESDEELMLYLERKLFRSIDFFDFRKTSVYLAV